ncbi:MAG: MarR family winged helix-turn-helix transcriptional regulator [Saprospiraceae bacterium]
MLNQSTSSKSLIFLTNRISRMLAHKIRRSFSEQQRSLKSEHMGILADLWREDGIRQQDLVVSTIKNKGTIARALNFLEKENIVVRVPDTHDKRSKLIYLTHRGKQLQAELTPLADEAQQEITQNVDAGELKICLKVLSQIYDDLGDSCINNDIKQ